MLLVKAQLRVYEGQWPDLHPLLLHLAQVSLAEEGCLNFEILLDADEAAHVVVLQAWRDPASLERHEASAHVADFKQQAAPLMERYAPTEVYVVDRVEPLPSFLSQP